MKEIIMVGLGGAAGSILRYLSSQFVQKYNNGHFPLATFTINVIGCLLIGVLIGYFSKTQVLQNEWKLLSITGFCGGYTTFSAFASENLNLINNNQIGLALFYIALSIFLGIAAVWLGLLLSRA
ncbi:fluoride efflux transporter CrcB [Sphingobacterium kyonggiense]|uniref:Fluoride-specific ion channel FluC n=1 Tax=Sphingobacterium kyonggiense TaxID=714075 RepID=A0ABP7YKJ1_9SPHI